MTVASIVWRKVSFGLLVAAELAAAAAVTAVATSVPASAQFFFDDRYPFLDPRSRRRGGYFDPNAENDRPPDFSRAPAATPRKPDAPPVSTRILVLGDSMADWLAYGLEDALTETPEIGIVRKHRTHSGLIRYDTRTETEWAQAARDLIAAEKPQAIVMMIGLHDRQAIRERVAAPAKPGAPQAGQQVTARPGAQQPGQQQPQAGQQQPADLGRQQTDRR
jgi:hypothetical protein